jgi:hypothetical protein
MNWVFVSQMTAFFIVTAVKTSNLTFYVVHLAEGDKANAP